MEIMQERAKRSTAGMAGVYWGCVRDKINTIRKYVFAYMVFTLRFASNFMT